MRANRSARYGELWGYVWLAVAAATLIATLTCGAMVFSPAAALLGIFCGPFVLFWRSLKRLARLR